MTHTGALAGTLSHMAPEVLRGERADVRSDVWALGVTLYIMTFGSFSGLAVTFPLLIKQLYGGFEGAPDPLAYAFLGPLVVGTLISASTSQRTSTACRLSDCCKFLRVGWHSLHA